MKVTLKTVAVTILLFGGVSCGMSIVQGAPLQRIERVAQQQRQAPPPNVQRALRPNGTLRPAARRTLVQDAIYGFYTRQFQQDGDFPAEVREKIRPFLDSFLQDRFEISERRGRALNQLRQAIARNASEEELGRLTRDLDATDAEFQANHEKFLSSVDPLLSPRQQAKVRVIQDLADKRIRQTIDAVQNQNARRPAAGEK